MGSHSRLGLLLQHSSRRVAHPLRVTGRDLSLFPAQSSRVIALRPERLGRRTSALPLTSRCSRNISWPIPSGSDSSRLQLTCDERGGRSEARRARRSEAQKKTSRPGAERWSWFPGKINEPKTTNKPRRMNPKSRNHHGAKRSQTEPNGTNWSQSRMLP